MHPGTPVSEGIGRTEMLAEAATLGTVLGKQQGIPALLRELDGSLRTVAESGIVPVGAKGWVNWRWGVG